MRVGPIKLLLLSCLTVIWLSGCKSTDEQAEAPQDNLPEQQDIAEQQMHLPASMAIMPFTNQTEKMYAEDMLRRTLHGHLARTNYEIPHVNHVDSRLALLDPNQQLVADDTAMLAQILGVDALLFGNVVAYDTIYAGIYAEINFEVEMTMVDAQGDLLWQQTFSEVSREGGVSTSPWGMLYSMAVTAMHLDDDNLFAVADKLGRNIALTIPQPKEYQHGAAFIESVLHDGAGKTLKYGDTLKVGVKGDANKFASVTLQGINEVFQLKEQEPGVYLGEIPVANDWQSDGMMVTGFLQSSDGVTSKAISPAGLIKIDNQAPEPVEQISIVTHAQSAVVSWQHPESNMAFKIFRKTSVGMQQVVRTTKREVRIEHQASPFEVIDIVVVAVDQAGNESPARDTSHVVYPMASLYDAMTLADKRLPEIIDGQVLLRKSAGPFLIDRQVILSSGSSLYVEPGTVLEFTSTGNLLVQGSLFTFGGEMVQFKPFNNALTSQGFLTLDSREHVQLSGIRIQQSGIAIDVIQGKVLLSDCELLDNQYSAIVVSGNASLSAENCTIKGSNTSAVVTTDQASVRINNSKFIENLPFHIQHASVVQMDATNNTWIPEASYSTVLGDVRY